MANGLVALLDEESDALVRALWDELGSRFGLNGMTHVPWPHVSLVVATEWDRTAVEEVAAKLVAEHRAPSVSADAWSIFTGPTQLHPALVRSVTRAPELEALHRDAFRELCRHLSGCSPYSAPERWNPHITLAMRDLTPGLAGAVTAWLATEDHASWQVGLPRLGLIEGDEHRHDLVAEFGFA